MDGVEPAMRGWIVDSTNYLPQAQIGDVKRSVAVSRVLESRRSDYQPGELLVGFFDWSEQADIDPASVTG